MKKIFALLLSMIGISSPVGSYAQQVDNVVEDAPVILQHSKDFGEVRASLMDSLKLPEKEFTYHTSHYSHSSHSSHHSHYSSRY